MRDIFKWDRTTENFFRYVSTKKFTEELGSRPGGRHYPEAKHFVVYIARRGRDHPPYLTEEMIVSRMDEVALDLKPYGEPVAEAGYDIHDIPGLTREQAKIALHTANYRRRRCCERDNDWDGNCDIHSAPGVPRAIVLGNLQHRIFDLELKMSSKVDVGFFNRKMGELHESMAGIKVKIQTLFNAVYWILRHLGAVK